MKPSFSYGFPMVLSFTHDVMFQGHGTAHPRWRGACHAWCRAAGWRRFSAQAIRHQSLEAAHNFWHVHLDRLYITIDILIPMCIHIYIYITSYFISYLILYISCHISYHISCHATYRLSCIKAYHIILITSYHITKNNIILQYIMSQHI